MCFIISENKEKTAEQDIVVYKTLQAKKKGFLNNLLDRRGALYQKFTYHKYKILRKVRLVPTEGQFIDKGYHSYIDIEDAMRMATLYDVHMNREVCKFIIPKGAKYYENRYERVSNKIIYKGKI